jgi:hypothetical protein
MSGESKATHWRFLRYTRSNIQRSELALPNQRLLLAGRGRLSRRTVSLTYFVCGGCGTPRSRSASRYTAMASVESMRQLLSLVLFLTACSGSLRPHVAPYSPAEGVEGARPRIMKDVLDPSSAFLGLPSLATALLPADIRELRISTGTGIILGAEYPLIRIVAGPTGVVGEVIRFRAILSGKDSANRRVSWTARIVKPAKDINWQGVLQTLDSLGVETLPPPVYNHGFTDAGDLTVEVRRGSVYRAYEVNAPGRRTDSVGVRAAAIAGVVSLLDNRLVRTNHRGITRACC